MNITWELLAAVAGGIVLIGNCGAVLHRWLQPAMNMRKDVEGLLERTDAIEKHESNDLERLEHMEEMMKLLCQSMIAQTNHQIDGNGIEELKQSRKELQDLLIKM